MHHAFPFLRQYNSIWVRSPDGINQHCSVKYRDPMVFPKRERAFYIQYSRLEKSHHKRNCAS